MTIKTTGRDYYEKLMWLASESEGEHCQVVDMLARLLIKAIIDLKETGLCFRDDDLVDVFASEMTFVFESEHDGTIFAKRGDGTGAHVEWGN